MPRLAFLLLFGLAGCASADSAAKDPPRPVEMQGWRLASGREPSRAEFDAVVASCQDRTRRKGGPLDTCLQTLGLRRSP